MYYITKSIPDTLFLRILVQSAGPPNFLRNFFTQVKEEVHIRASQIFRSYLPHSGLQSEWSGALLVAVS